MHLSTPKLSTFWAAIVLAVVAVIVYIVHLFMLSVPYVQPAAFLLLLIGFGLLVLGLTQKGF